MIIGLFAIFQIILIIMFGVAFYTKQELLWGLVLILSGVLMISAFNIGIPVYQYDNVTGIYNPVIQSYSYPYLMGINVSFFGISLILFFFDIFEKYGNPFKRNKDE